ncbi:hypothetical protein GA0074696_5556 [Micromonospora purpureochromogenes]|uniref:Uncharacterized protein n=1 Tax=Micromonospora purpureochromogenes TaxID=47872 RepID=A0A1C5A8W2_9ACTN|nr:hypothetical protein [Micromonospora purpureochromogenes]SCF41599.1 hypothetical protein GA0074696_5556 [Micromonospora purpureochromogenes]
MAGRRWLVCVIAVAVLGGCATGSGPGGDDLDRLRRQARDALTRYDQAVLAAGGAQAFVPVGELTGQLGDWEQANGDNNKQALLTGRIVPATALPALGQPTGKVVWENGRTQPVPLASAEEALAQVRAAGVGDCSGCVPLEVTAARLTTVRIPTTRGPAAVPAWEYTLKGTAVRLTRIAVARAGAVVVTPPAWGPEYPRGGLAIESATGSTTSGRLVVAFTGSPGPGSQPCGVDYSAEAAESANAVVVIVIEHRHGDGESCGDVGARRTATAELARPLGERAVLEVQQGLPVAVTITS